MNQTTILYVFLSVLIGVSTVIQGGTNIILALWSGDALRSTCIQFIIGTICLLPSLCLNKDNHTFNNIICECKQNRMNCFVFLNGFLGVIFISSAIYAAPVIGFGPYIISLIIGQILTSTLIDQYGLFWSTKRKLSTLNIIGVIVTVVGQILFQVNSFAYIATQKDTNEVIAGLCVLFSIFAGICVTIQAALNQRLRVIMNDTAYKASFVSFVIGTFILIMINIMLYAMNGDWFIIEQQYFEWYMFLGGIFGAFVVTMFVICPPNIGFVTTYICSICGSMVTSVIFDYVSAFGIHAQDAQISVMEVIGVTVVLIGAILVNVRKSSDANIRNESLSLISSSANGKKIHLPMRYMNNESNQQTD